MPFYVYFAKSVSSQKIYVGSTHVDPKLRVEQHNQGSNKWSSANLPLKLVYYETYICKKDALTREKFYKTGFGRKIKDAIIRTVEN